MDKIDEIINLHKEGYSYNQIARMINVSKSTVAFYCREKDNKKIIERRLQKEREKNEYEKIVCNTIKKYNNWNQVCTMLNKRATTTTVNLLKDIAERNGQDFSHFDSKNIKTKKAKKFTLDEILCENSQYKNSSKLVGILIKNGLREHKCEGCNKTETIFKGVVYKIPLQAHHINGVHTDNRIDNIELLCPTCHSLTDNFAGRNIKRKKILKKCKYCGNDYEDNGELFCSERCFEKYKLEQNKCPSETELIEDYRNMGSFLKIGQKYDVSDNTVRKWFKKYNLPFKVKDIRSFIIGKFGYQEQWYEYRSKRDMSKTLEKISKKIDVYEYEKGFIQTCRSLNEAAKVTGISKNTIRKNCNGQRINNKHYYFKYNCSVA